MERSDEPLPSVKFAVIVSSDMTIKAFLLRHLRGLSESYQLSVVANTHDAQLLVRECVNAELRRMRIVRPISPAADLGALVALCAFFIRGRHRGVLSVTPKAGLLAMLAAFVTRVPVRIHIFTGQVWATRSGLARAMFKCIDRLIAALATDILVDGEPQRQFLIAEGVLREEESRVLGLGSLSGVDGQRFKPDSAARTEIRKTLDLSDNAILFLYLGRLNRDKGVLDLTQAFAQLAPSFPTVHLLMVGPDEAGISPQIRTLCAQSPTQLHLVGYTNEPERYLAASDVFCLPSYREGFPTSVLEAAASGIPTIGSRIYGMADAVVEGTTGLLHAPGDAGELASCLRTMIESPSLRMTLGAQARSRALAYFSAEHVTNTLIEYVRTRLDEVI